MISVPSTQVEAIQLLAGTEGKREILSDRAHCGASRSNLKTQNLASKQVISSCKLIWKCVICQAAG